MSSDAAGMMEGAYFVSRSDIINWLNSFLKVNLKEVQETASGAIACQLMDAIYPNTIPMSKVDFSCKDDYEFIKNYKLLQSCFSKNGITKQIDVERLIRGKYQDNFEFMQWMKWFFDTHYNHNGPEYDAIGRRSHSKGGREITARNVPMKSNTSTTSTNTMNRTSRVSTVSTINSNTNTSSGYMNKKTSNVSNTSLNTSTSQYSTTRSSLRGNESISKLNTSLRRVSLTTPNSHIGSTNHNNDEQLNKRISELEEENKKITQELEQYKELLTQEKNTSTNLIHERDFYYYKLRDVEDTVIGFEENNGSNEFTAQIKQTLYAGSDDTDNNNNDNNNMDVNTSNDIMQE